MFDSDTLNKFAALGKEHRIEARRVIQEIYKSGNPDAESIKEQCPFSSIESKMGMPMFIRDYTDFYSSKNHAHNVGVMMRGPDNALQPNWSHLPVGYHGRASSVVLSGTSIRRPRGQTSADLITPALTDCKLMDFELEMGSYMSHGNDLGNPIAIGEASDHIFGHCLLNDWSARDIQKWEYVPLGPFTAKNFASTVSPWVITPEALAPFKKALPV